MQKITYVDLHCDTLTECARLGGNLESCNLQTDVKSLKACGCAAQCFAVFTDGENSARQAEEYFAFYERQKAYGFFMPVRSFSDIERCLSGEAFGSILTVENLGFIGENIDILNKISDLGVKMASLVWNHENALAYPNLIFRGGEPKFGLREKRGLKEAGRRAVERLDELKIIIDISHLSDGGAEEILRGRKIPIVASHSCAAEVCDVSRNLTDGLIAGISECGGVIGVNFCRDFLGADDVFSAVCAHVSHFIDVGGEDVIALGSDFDGIPAPVGLENCSRMPALLDYLSSRLGSYATEKLAYKNFARVFKEVCG